VKRIVLFLICILFILSIISCVSSDKSIPINSRRSILGLVIAIDPGHGDIDHGAISDSGVKEDKLNLQVSLILKEKLKDAGATVFMTRESNEVDYSGDSSTRKRRDLENRAKLIRTSNPNAVISIHMNKYPNKKFYGPQTFFLKDNPEGKKLAEDIQKQLLNSLPSYKKFRIVEGEYFMLHVVDSPSVLVECGFLSNIDDTKRLQEPSYQQKIAESIFKGICDYFGT
jgi:N-acetylmuramoyl-L-alanine amidase